MAYPFQNNIGSLPKEDQVGFPPALVTTGTQALDVSARPPQLVTTPL